MVMPLTTGMVYHGIHVLLEHVKKPHNRVLLDCRVFQQDTGKKTAEEVLILFAQQDRTSIGEPSTCHENREHLVGIAAFFQHFEKISQNFIPIEVSVLDASLESFEIVLDEGIGVILCKNGKNVDRIARSMACLVIFAQPSQGFNESMFYIQILLMFGHALFLGAGGR